MVPFALGLDDIYYQIADDDDDDDDDDDEDDTKHNSETQDWFKLICSSLNWVKLSDETGRGPHGTAYGSED